MIAVLQTLSTYRNLFLVAFEVVLFFLLVSLVRSLYQKWVHLKNDEKHEADKFSIRADFDGTVDEVERQNMIRQVLAPDGVDPSPNAYMGLSDGGKEVFVRFVTLSAVPKRVTFAKTFAELFEFPNATYTVFVDPIDSETMSRKLDHHINVLEVEEISSEGNTNRVRKLGSQIRKTTGWAAQVEDGDKKFFDVGFLFRFVADSVDELNRITDDFRALAQNKKIEISNCYGAQSEAFLSSLPLNRKGGLVFKGNINSDCIKKITMDQNAASVLLNYTSSHFTHKRGIPLGRNLFSGLPFVFDIFDGSHDGFTTIISGKTGSGKSATIKMMIERYVPLGYRFVIIDSQQRKGTSEGEYSSCSEINGGVHYQISSDGNNIMNPFDVQESIVFEKVGFDSGREVRTLDLNSAITEIVSNLRIMIRGGLVEKDAKGENMDSIMDSDINDVLTRITKGLFTERGIYHGDADSLYEEGTLFVDGALQAGIVTKKLPTITDFYKKLIIEKATNKKPELDAMYRFVVNNLRESVRELYYTESGKFYSREQFLAMPDNPQRLGEKLWSGEPVMELHGIRPYYDGQSSFVINRNCPVTCIDISLLTMKERRSARNIALHQIDQQFVQKNSEQIGKADKLVVIIDEAHESFEDSSARSLLSNEVRTARKRNVGLIFSTQTVEEFERYEQTADILSQAAVKFIFKQEVSNKKKFKESLNITEQQADIIQNRLGVVTDMDDPEAKSRHRGEACVIDGGQVQFIKVDYLKSVERLAVETDVSTVMKVMRGA